MRSGTRVSVWGDRVRSDVVTCRGVRGKFFAGDFPENPRCQLSFVGAGDLSPRRRRPPADMASWTASARCALVAPAATARGRLGAEPRLIHPVRRSSADVRFRNASGKIVGTGTRKRSARISRRNASRLIAHSSSFRPAESSSAPVVVWFRVGDLRTHDHPGLTRAFELGAPVVPVFVFDETELRDFAPATARATHEAVRDLREALRVRGLRLVVRTGDAADIVPRIVTETRACSVSVQIELEWARRSAYARAIKKINAVAEASETDVSVHEWSLELREDTEVAAQKTRAALHAATKENIKSAPLTAFATADARAAFRGPIAAPAPAPASFPAGGAAGYGALGDEHLGDEDFECEMPSLASVVAMARAPDDPDDVRHDAAEAVAEAVVTDASYRKKRAATGTENAFVLFSESATKTRALEEAARAAPPVPFRLPGGEAAALRFLDGFLDFYTATNDAEYRRMYDRIIEVGKPEAFFRIFGDVLRVGALSPRLVYAKCNAWEASSKRATDLCANARNVAAARDYQASVAKDALEAGAHGPGVPLVGAYNVCSGKL